MSGGQCRSKVLAEVKCASRCVKRIKKIGHTRGRGRVKGPIRAGREGAFKQRRLEVCCTTCHMAMHETDRGKLCRVMSDAATRCVSGCIKWLVDLRR